MKTNPLNKHKYHYNYMITNLNNNMRYIGVRTCNCCPIKDINYMGSSVYLKNAILREGKQWFKKEILSIWSTRELASEHEIRLHNYFEVAINPMFYNKCKQTSIGFDCYIKGMKQSESHKRKRSESLKGHVVSELTRKKLSEYNKGKKLSEETINKISNSSKKMWQNNEIRNKLIKSMTGLKRLEESKELMSIKKQEYWDNITENEKNNWLEKHNKGIKNRRDFKGKNNPNYGNTGLNNKLFGKKYVTKDRKDKLIFKNEIEEYLSAGWILGRKKKEI